MAETIVTAVSGDDGDKYTRIGVGEAELHANAMKGSNVIDVGRGIGRETSPLRILNLAPNMGYLTIRKTMPTFM